ACEVCSTEIGLHEPSLIEDRPVEFCIAKFGLVEPRATQNGAGKIDAGEIETRELLAREIGRLKGCCGSDRGLDVRARHLRRCHPRRRQVDVLHHILRGSGNGGGKTEHHQCTDLDRRAYHGRRSTSVSAVPPPPLHWRHSERVIAQRLYARALRDHVLATVRDEGSALELLD